MNQRRILWRMRKRERVGNRGSKIKRESLRQKRILIILNLIE